VRISGREAAQAAALELAERARAFEPDVVLSVLSGGEEVGRAIGEALGVPALGLDLRYPPSRLLSRAPALLRLGLWPLKELGYRMSRPRLAAGALEALPRSGRAVLADDTASSGRTLRAAFEALAAHGLRRSDLFVAVIRCGDRARHLVDAYVTDRAIW